MNDIDKIIYEIFIIRNSLISVQEYIFKKELINSFYTTFTQSTKHILEIYKDRLEFSKITEENYIGLDLTVDMLQNTELDEVRISTLEDVEASCTIFSSENYSIIIGIIFTKIPISWISNS